MNRNMHARVFDDFKFFQFVQSNGVKKKLRSTMTAIARIGVEVFVSVESDLLYHLLLLTHLHMQKQKVSVQL